MPSVDPTTITAPGSSVPGVGPNPSSNPTGVTPPTASNPNTPVVPPVNGPVTGVTPPTGSSGPKIDPFGTLYDERTGKCIEDAGWLPNDCDTTKSLEDEARNKAKAIETATGAVRERLMLELARIEAQLAAREALGNDRLADAYIGRIEQSNLYDSLKDNPRAKTMLWLGIAGGLESGAYRRYSMSPKQYLESLVRGAENLRFAGRDSKGRPIFVQYDKLPATGAKPSNTNNADLTTRQKSIRCVQNGEIRLSRILDLASFACLTRTLKHRIRPASKHILDLQCSRA
jgi:hypothetical protein